MLRRLMRPAFGLCPHEEGRRKGRQPGRSHEEAGGAPGLCLTRGSADLNLDNEYLLTNQEGIWRWEEG